MSDRIVKSTVLKAPHDRVWRAISDTKQFGTWFGVDIAGSFTPGARLACKITATKVDPEIAKSQEPYSGTPFEIVVDKVEPMRVLSFHWHPYGVEAGDLSKEPMTLVEFALDEVSGGTKLTITESGFDKIPLERRAKAFAANEGGWTAQLELIAKFLAGGYAA
ncbi:MAG: SRPBCC family protein [Kofleriaceae bacterium]|nr:SRPBCC family protein [Kofleriaceae bacterium]